MKRKAGCVVKGLAAAYLISVGMLLLLALVLLKLQLEDGMIRIGIFATYVVSCFVGGWICSRRTERRKFLWGLITGILYAVILFAAAQLGDGTVQAGPVQTMTVFIVCIFAGMFGGMLA